VIFYDSENRGYFGVTLNIEEATANSKCMYPMDENSDAVRLCNSGTEVNFSMAELYGLTLGF